MYKKSTKKVAPAPQPYCAHCFNLGKDESVFRSHWLRKSPDPSSPVVCPELLATECPYCFKQGHTKSRCPVILAQEKTAKKEAMTRKVQEEKVKLEEKTKKIQKTNGVSKFAALMEDSDSENDIQVVKVSKNIKIAPKVEEFPALTSNKVVPTASPVNSYAAITSKSKSTYKDEQFLNSKLVKTLVPILTRSIAYGSSVQPIPTTFWEEHDPEEDEMEYAIRKIEEDKHKQKLLTLRASTMNWMEDSDDEEW